MGQAGFECVLSVGGVTVGIAKDVTPTISREPIDDTTRGGAGWKEWVSGLVEWGVRFTLRYGSCTRRMCTHLIGRHMVYPVLAAVAAALGEGLPLEPILPSLEALQPTPGRMQPVKLENGAYVLRDDYKSSLETIETALESLSEIPARQKIVVVGEIAEPPGSQGPRYKAIGERLAGIASKVVLLVKKRGLEGYRSGLNQAGFPRDAVFDAKGSLV